MPVENVDSLLKDLFIIPRRYDATGSCLNWIMRHLKIHLGLSFLGWNLLFLFEKFLHSCILGPFFTATVAVPEVQSGTQLRLIDCVRIRMDALASLCNILEVAENRGQALPNIHNPTSPWNRLRSHKAEFVFLHHPQNGNFFQPNRAIADQVGTLLLLISLRGQIWWKSKRALLSGIFQKKGSFLSWHAQYDSQWAQRLFFARIL